MPAMRGAVATISLLGQAQAVVGAEREKHSLSRHKLFVVVDLDASVRRTKRRSFLPIFWNPRISV